MTRRLLPAAMLLFLSGCGASSGPTGADDVPGSSPTPAPVSWTSLPRPNVLLVIADDLGWGDLSVNGSTTIKTPRLDQLAAEGVRFTSAYVPTPLCAPSRAAIYTGRFGGRNGIPWNPPNGLHPDEVVFASVLRSAGYATALVGKWHLGWGASNMPIHWGFDYYAGIPNGSDVKQWVEGDAERFFPLGSEQLTPHYTDLALEWLATVPRGKPWLLVVGHRDPHTPLIPAPGFYKHSAGGLYGDVVEGLDHHVGRLLDGVRDLGHERDTLVVFLSDNGPAREQPEWPTTGSTGPFSGQKGSCQEGGVRVPMIVRWPAAGQGGRVSDAIVSSLDIFPTLVAVARGQMPERRKYDGANIAGLLTGEQAALRGAGIDGDREILTFQTAGRLGGFRSGPYKYLRDGTWGRGGLFDLRSDQGERHDLSPSLPDLARQLDERMDEVVR
jgi:arylsulfatase A